MLYIVSITGLGILVGLAINLVAKSIVTERPQSLLATKCCLAPKPALVLEAIQCYSGRSDCAYFCDRYSSRFHNIGIVESGTGFLFGLVGYNFNSSLATLVILIYMSILVLICTIDIRNRLVPNKVVCPSTVLILLLFPLSLTAPEHNVWQIYIVGIQGGIMGFLVMLLLYLILPGGIGAGDVKLGGLIGVAVGSPSIFATLAFAFIAGGVAALLLLSLKFMSLKDKMPYAPYLAGSTIVILLFGDNIPILYMALSKL